MTSVIIIGAGPAGLAAAIQLERYGIHSLVFEQSHPGGLLRNAHCVENFPGFPHGVSGPALVEHMLQQAKNHGVEIVPTTVLGVNPPVHDTTFEILTTSGSYTASYLLVASGTTPIRLPDKTIAPEAKNHVYYEVADLPVEFGTGSKLDIAIIGAGDAAYDYAFHLSAHHNVAVFSRSASHRCLPLLWQRAEQQRDFIIVPATEVNAIRRTESGLELALSDAIGTQSVAFCNFVLAAIGRKPALDFLPDALQPQNSFIESGNQLARKIYFIGDVKNGIFRQTAIATGDGIRAAMEIAQTIRNI